jgi:hypothetical protein
MEIDGLKLTLVVPTGRRGKEVPLETVEKLMTKEKYRVD